MEKQIAHWSYWLGLVCFAIALAWRALNALGVGPVGILQGVSYMTFYKGTLLLLVTAIATANYTWLKTLKP